MAVFLRRRWIVICAASIALVSLFLKATLPVQALAESFVDDAMFVRLARFLVEGSWLGPYDDRTLAKGVFYPIFMATAFAMGVPLKIAEQVVYLAASGLMSWSVARLSQSQRLGACIFFALAFNPVLWDPPLSRTVPMGLYTSLSLAVLALASVLLLDDRERLRGRVRFALGAFLGAVFACFWLTREESAYLYPAIAVLIVASFLKRSVPGQGWTEALRHGTRSLALDLVLPLCVFVLIACSLATLNYIYYGVFLTNEFREGNFKKAYSAIMRVQPATWTRYIVFSDDVASQIYQVSPSSVGLQSYFGNQYWRLLGCGALRLNPCPSGIGIAWFSWVMREAVKHAGHYETAAKAQSFYAQLAREINDACDRKQISCLPQRSSFAPPFQREYLQPLLGSTWDAGRALLGLGNGRVGTPPSRATPPVVEAFEDLVGPVAPPEDVKPPLGEIVGLIVSPGSPPTLFIDEKSGRPVHARIEVEPADLAAPAAKYWKDRGMSNTVRYKIETDCPRSACVLRVYQEGRVVLSAALESLAPGAALKLEKQALLFVTSNTAISGVVAKPPSKLTTRREQVVWSVMRAFAGLYSWAMPPLAILALVGFVAYAVRQRSSPQRPALLALALACATACVCRIVLIAYVDVSAFHAVSAYYLAPATPFAIVLVTLGLYLGYATLRRAFAPS
jgi:hypothetical protein